MTEYVPSLYVDVGDVVFAEVVVEAGTVASAVVVATPGALAFDEGVAVGFAAETPVADAETGWVTTTDDVPAVDD